MNNKEPKVYYDKEQDILYIDKDTYDRDVMTIYERQQKAIEYIKEHTLYSFDLYDKDDVSSYFEKASPKDLLNILQGDNDNETNNNN